MNRFHMLTVAALILFASVASAAPASASGTSYRQVCGFTSLGYRCWLQPVSTQTQTQTRTQPGIMSSAAAPTGATGTASAQGLTAQEQQMLNLVNQERARHGLPALRADLAATRVARVKSQDMISRNYFSHNSPTYGTPFQMLQRFGVSYRTAGENIAGNRSVEAAHRALMNSPGHRANILSRSFTHIGIGIVPGGQYGGLMFTQMFLGR